MKAIISTSIFLLFALACMGQKVKEKNNIYYVDDSAFVQKTCKKIIADPCPYTTADGKQNLFVIVAFPYQKIIQVREGNATVAKSMPAYYYMVQFSLVNKDFTTLMDPKDIVREMYNSGFILPNGSVDPDLLAIFIQRHNIPPPSNITSDPDVINNRW